MHAGALILIEGKKGTIIFKDSVLANANFESNKMTLLARHVLSTCKATRCSHIH